MFSFQINNNRCIAKYMLVKFKLKSQTFFVLFFFFKSVLYYTSLSNNVGFRSNAPAYSNNTVEYGAFGVIFFRHLFNW